jgi:signal transduction histidine kinase
LNASSPFIKTLLNENKLTRVSNKQTDVEKEEIERGIYPEYEEFVGLRLESIQKEESLIRGILCVTDNTVIDTPRENTIKIILEAVHTRCINELIQLQRQEQLIIARDLAILDAENKLKFLADMSHEIRYSKKKKMLNQGTLFINITCRTPMNAVIALTDLLLQERSTLNMEQIEHLEVIQTSGSHLLTVK